MLKKINPLLYLLLAITLLFSLSACKQQTKTESFDWELYGAWLTEEGSLSGSFSLSLSGELPSAPETDIGYETKMEIQWPENFSIANMGQRTYFIYADIVTSQPHNFWCAGTYYDAAANMPRALQFVIFPEYNAVVFNTLQSHGAYLVAAADPNADLAQILQLFLEMYS